MRKTNQISNGVEEKNKKQDKKEDKKCPLCEISEETIKKLKEAGENKRTEQKPEKNNED